MRRPVFLIFLNAMILIVIFSLLTQSLVLMQRLAVADRLQGEVLVQRNGQGSFYPLQAHAAIKTGDVVRTGVDGSAEFKWLDGTRWKLMPNTTLLVKKATYNALHKAEQSQLNLSTGKVFIRIVQALKPSSKFEVETPTAVAAVRGTIFSVEVKDGRTRVDVYKGSVQVSSSGDHCSGSDMIEPGQEAIAPAQGKLSTATAASNAEFESQPSIVIPELQATLMVLGDGKHGMIRGSTEHGSVVTVNGAETPVLGNGVFLKWVALADGSDGFHVTVTDRHGAQNTVFLATRPAPS